jgi:dihydrofolate reductase
VGSSRIVLDITTSLDGYVAGPNQTLEEPLGAGGERLHDWMTRLASFKSRHGQEGGEVDGESEAHEAFLARVGAYVMGRRMFSGGEGPWADDPKSSGWWGEDPPFGAPVFVVTHQAREALELEGTTFTFVTEGVESAVAQARDAADGKDVAVIGGANIADECLRAGLLDELRIHVAPILLGGGARLFEGVPPGTWRFTSVRDSPYAVHFELEPVRTAQ